MFACEVSNNKDLFSRDRLAFWFVKSIKTKSVRQKRHSVLTARTHDDLFERTMQSTARAVWKDRKLQSLLVSE